MFFNFCFFLNMLFLNMLDLKFKICFENDIFYF